MGTNELANYQLTHNMDLTQNKREKYITIFN